MALLTVGEWFGSAIISKLVDTAYSYLAEQMLPADIKSELRRLKAALPKITAVMGVAEALKLKHPGVNDWLAQFKEAFFAAEDVLDELKYWELAEMVKNRDEVSGSSSLIGSLKRKFTSSAIISKDTLKRLRETVELLDLAATDVGDFLQLAIALDVNKPVYTSSRETTSLLTEPKVFGRESEKATIIDWLKKPVSHNSISTFCIVGPGGLGKTTLAQLIFDEISKDNHFDKIIWICVSTSFSVEDITRKILQELGEKIHDNEPLNRLQINLKEKIISKKILFILDDVWNDDKLCDWEKLIAPLKFVQQGSKILLTTRMKSVADMLAHVLHVDPRENIVLGGLKEQELLELFNKHAFNNYNSNNYKDLQNIRNDIVKKLRGSPLAAKVIGSLLNFNMDFHYWKRILSNDSLINLEQAKDVVDVLKLSYYHLPANLQECFRFCSIFPQDYEFNKDELIRMWMASGFIRQEFHEEDRQEDIGEEYFNHLLRKSFFERNPPRYPHQNDVYVMHDLLHDLAQNVSKGECSRVEPESKINIIPSTAQHVCVHESQIQRIFNLRNLRSLVITLSGEYDNRDRFVLPNGLLKETLRLLVIRGRCELPKEFSRLIHLRFLKFDPRFVQHYLSEFFIPNSIYKLYHMQVLDLACYVETHTRINLETTGITNLVSLRYMDLPNHAMENIHGVHKLTSLRKLNFCVGQECGCHIDELGMLNNLRSLSIKNIENVGDPIEARKANLSKKESLITLSLNWSSGINSDNHKQVIDNLQPHSNLKELEINSYAGHISPVWMMDSSHLYLSSLTLSGCPNWETLPFLGQIPHLKLLSLIELNNVKEVDYSCDSTSDCAFPSLEKLYCDDMPKWESWAAAHICYGFPNLKELLITNCPNLPKLPAIPSSLFKFEVNYVGINSLPDMHHGSSITAPAPSCMKSLLRVVDIQNCPKLTSLNGFMQQENLDLQTVKDLTITHCENLVQLPTGAFGNFVSLKHLSINDIPNLEIVDNQSILLPNKLESLKMRNCGELDVPLLESTSQLPALATLFIKDSEHITCIPTGAFGNFVSLKHLSIKDIPNLEIVDNQSILLPIKLESLKMRNCGELDVPLLESASQLPELASLSIGGSEHITCIPSSENAFTSLCRLKISRCNKLIELSSMQQAHTVNPGNNLPSLKISDLEIDHLCLLLIEPLKCLRFVSDLEVGNCSEMEALPEQWLLQNRSTLKSLTISNANSLRSLPGTMVMLTSLERLDISNATSLEEIPEMPASLIYTMITEYNPQLF
ncbi:putative disease resistance protein RGA3 [Carex rostrata]